MNRERLPEQVQFRPRSADADGAPMVPVDPDELRRAIQVWLRVMPRHLWAAYLAMLEVDPKRRNPADRADPVEILGAYLAAEFARAH